MRRYSFIFLGLLLLLLLSLPDLPAGRLRSFAVATLSPSWRHMQNLKELFLNLTTVLPSGGYNTPPQVTKELEMIRLENYQLKAQVAQLSAELNLEKVIHDQSNQLMQMTEVDAYAQRRKAEIFRQLELYSHAITARVIFRESGSWKSSVWVNVGEETNKRLNSILVEKNSPVVLGTTVVGLVDYVGKHRSRVRLITDPTIVPSIRVIRGDIFLAKGELQGTRYPAWRSRGTHLKGVGFNYDFDDVEGAARNLRTGKDSIPLILQGDSVVTTGMDGLFPAGLRIGSVTRVHPLKEGSTSYEADILSPIENFETIQFLTVLPAINLDQ